jgi:hypothetical protein
MFKVGDRVRVLKKSKYSKRVVGKIGKIISIDGCLYHISIPDYMVVTCFEDGFRGLNWFEKLFSR